MAHKSNLLAFPAIRASWLTRPVGHLDTISSADLFLLEPREVGLLRSWLLSDSSADTRRINWNAVFGIGFATCLSAGIWTGIGLALAHLWK